MLYIYKSPKGYFQIHFVKTIMNITTTIYEPDLLKDLVEKIASGHKDSGFCEADVPRNFKALETSCTFAQVLGSFELANDNSKEHKIIIPFTTCFLFTCTKEKYGLFNLEWSSSLS